MTRIAVGIACVVAIVSTGCATGPAFTTAEAPHGGRAVVYLYRVSALSGAAISHGVRLDGHPMGRLLNGSHLRLELPAAGRLVELQAEGCPPLQQPLAPRPGQILYVQLALVSKTVELGGKYYFDYGCQLVQRSASEALPAITGLARAD